MKVNDNSDLPDLILVYNELLLQLKQYSKEKSVNITLNRFYFENEYFHFNISVQDSKRTRKYLLSFFKQDLSEYMVRGNKWLHGPMTLPWIPNKISFDEFLTIDNS